MIPVIIALVNHKVTSIPSSVSSPYSRRGLEVPAPGNQLCIAKYNVLFCTRGNFCFRRMLQWRSQPLYQRSGESNSHPGLLRRLRCDAKFALHLSPFLLYSPRLCMFLASPAWLLSRRQRKRLVVETSLSGRTWTNLGVWTAVSAAGGSERQGVETVGSDHLYSASVTAVAASTHIVRCVPFVAERRSSLLCAGADFLPWAACSLCPRFGNETEMPRENFQRGRCFAIWPETMIGPSLQLRAVHESPAIML